MSASPLSRVVSAPSTLELALGRRIVQLRATRGLTLDRLAQMSGFTKGYLSKIENSKVIPPIGTLIRIARELDVEISDLLQSAGVAPQPPVSIARGDRRARVVKGEATFGYDDVPLADDRHDKHMEPFVMLFQEHVDKDIRFEHEGEGFMFVLSGRVEFEAMLEGGLKRWVLSVGDSAYFDSQIPQRGRSLGGESEVLVVIYRPRAGSPP
jgi:transcriptional regulator with XRE-family HTH domain